MYLEFYQKQLGEIPEFLEKYLKCPSINRLKKIGYFCGMDYASKNIYKFQEKISRYDHSLSVALMVWKLTHNKKATIAGLFHDISTPCFAHAIDYMNQDYEKQESTELFTQDIILNDQELMKCLKEDHIFPEEVISFKDYSVVDNERPRLCADRLDGIILTSISWTKEISFEDIEKIIDDIIIIQNEEGQDEIAFQKAKVVDRVIELNDEIDEYCHSKEDNYMMSLLGSIAKKGIEKKLFHYEDLYSMNEEEIIKLLNESSDEEIKELLEKFYHITKKEVPEIDIPNLKKRRIEPILLGKRIKKN
ncbi:MAG: hypothetical protein IJG68_08150 [Bacilli bacterium]|nr:hypothetical protein [Bacilli bacterium]